MLLSPLHKSSRYCCMKHCFILSEKLGGGQGRYSWSNGPPWWSAVAALVKRSEPKHKLILGSSLIFIKFKQSFGGTHPAGLYTIFKHILRSRFTFTDGHGEFPEFIGIGILFHSQTLISMHVRTPRSSILRPTSVLLLCLYGAGASSCTFAIMQSALVVRSQQGWPIDLVF
jgi:hypothetical protein